MVIGGNGGAWSDVARQTEDTLLQWLRYSGLTMEEFDKRICTGPYRIEEQKYRNGDHAITVYAQSKQIAEPLLWEKASSVTYPLTNFYVNTLLLLFVVAARTKDKRFEEEIRRYGNKLNY